MYSVCGFDRTKTWNKIGNLEVSAKTVKTFMAQAENKSAKNNDGKWLGYRAFNSSSFMMFPKDHFVCPREVLKLLKCF